MNIDRLIAMIGISIGVLGIIASVYFGGRYYNLKNSIAAINSPGAEVIGGSKIITGNLNLEKPARHLNEEIKLSLDKNLASFKGQTITITSVMGDQEAFQYATEVKNYLESRGWSIEGINQAVYNKPILGQFIQKTSGGNIEIIIGGQE